MSGSRSPAKVRCETWRCKAPHRAALHYHCTVAMRCAAWTDACYSDGVSIERMRPGQGWVGDGTHGDRRSNGQARGFATACTCRMGSGLVPD